MRLIDIFSNLYENYDDAPIKECKGYEDAEKRGYSYAFSSHNRGGNWDTFGKKMKDGTYRWLRTPIASLN